MNMNVKIYLNFFIMILSNLPCNLVMCVIVDVVEMYPTTTLIRLQMWDKVVFDNYVISKHNKMGTRHRHRVIICATLWIILVLM